METIKINPTHRIDVTDFNKVYATISQEGVIHINLNGEMVNLQDIIDSMTELREFMLENILERE
jgi:hypothetical protein